MTQMYIVRCFICQEPFGIATGTHEVFLRTHQTFYCPHGHAQCYAKGESETTKLRRERDRLTQRLAEKDDDIKWQREQREVAERRLRAQKGQVTKLRNRAKAGVCPCCNRTFSQLARHMSSKHPDFQTEAPELHVIAGGRP